MVAGGPSADYSRVSVGETENALVAGVTAIWLNTQHRLAVWTLAQGVAKLAKNFGMPLSVLYVGDELIPFLRGLTKNSKVSSLEVSAFTRVAPKVLATFATSLGRLRVCPARLQVSLVLSHFEQNPSNMAVRHSVCSGNAGETFSDTMFLPRRQNFDR